MVKEKETKIKVFIRKKGDKVYVDELVKAITESKKEVLKELANK